MPYLPGLDGMRALAVLAVMVFHANHDWLPAGFLGVEVFFVISGYLITLLLIAEDERAGFVSLRAFWGRRFRRLLPALYLTLIGVTIYCALFLRDPLGKLRGDVVGSVFYVSNWYQIWTGQGYSASADFVPLRHLWSLAVEEQFYLIWPLVMIVLLRRGRNRLPQIGMWLIAIAFLIAAATSLLFHNGFYNTNVADYPSAYFEFFGRHIDTNNFLYLGTISRSSGILLGAGFAMLWRPLAVMRGPMRHKGRALDVVAIAGLIVLALIMRVYELIGSHSLRYYPPLFNGGLLLTGLCTLAIIAAVTHNASVIGTFLGNKVLNWVGTRSYGLYLFHWPIYQMIRKQAGLSLTFPKFVLAIIITVAVAEGSYRFLEMPVRKREFGARFRAGSPKLLIGLAVVGLLGGYAGISLAISDVKCTSKVECDAEAARAANEALLDGATTDSSASTAPTVVTATTIPGESTTSAAPTTAARRTVDFLALGESVMQGARTQLFDHGVNVDAEESRGYNGMRSILEQYLQGYDITGALIIQLGTNGEVSQAEYDQVMTDVAAIPKVYMMTVKGPGDYIAKNNAIIRALPTTHPNVQIIDWETAGKAIESELSPSDGFIHLRTTKAIDTYANLILAALGKEQIPIS